MRYIDSGSRDADSTLGRWLRRVMIDDEDVVELRWQTAFFSADILGYFAPLLARLREQSGTIHLLIGSNDGTTQAADLEVLLRLARPLVPGWRSASSPSPAASSTPRRCTSGGTTAPPRPTSAPPT
ncbi:MAG TPA: hypothetical protein VF228_23370 [Iamia sp.]